MFFGLTLVTVSDWRRLIPRIIVATHRFSLVTPIFHRFEVYLYDVPPRTHWWVYAHIVLRSHPMLGSHKSLFVQKVVFSNILKDGVFNPPNLVDRSRYHDVHF